MPDLDQKVTEYPESSFMNSTQIKLVDIIVQLIMKQVM